LLNSKDSKDSKDSKVNGMVVKPNHIKGILVFPLKIRVS